ncbi:hypothetical protein HYX06_06230 [Candidatus Woesearchaeota archaeon]|nr:hypothetical protein [Candidatus Woesearchaeota archaeon]
MRLAAIMLVVLYFFASFSYAQECDYSVEILINGTEFTKESFKWRMKAAKLEGPSTNITGSARIEDLSGNIVKSYKPWTNLPISKQKTSNVYSPNLNYGSYRIISEIIVGCDDMNKEDNIDTEIITIKQENMEILEANIAVQQLILENNEKQNTSSRAQENKDAMQPIQENELGSNPPMNEGQNNETKNQSNTKEYENTANLINENNQEISNPTDNIIKNTNKEYAYVSTNEKAKNMIVYFLLAVSVALNIALIWRR